MLKLDNIIVFLVIFAFSMGLIKTIFEIMLG